MGLIACALLVTGPGLASCSQDPAEELAALKEELKMEPTDFIGSEWIDHIPEMQPGTAYLQDMIRSLTGARGLDSAGRECAVSALEAKLEPGRTLGDFTIGIVGSSAVKKGKLSASLQPCASAEVLAQEQTGTYVAAADLDPSLPRGVLIDSANQAATDVGMNDAERECAVGKVYGELSDADLMLYFTAGAKNTSTNSKAAAKECVTGDRVLPVTKKAKQTAQADDANRERFRQLSQAEIDRALSDPRPATSVPSPVPAPTPTAAG